jgi:hypothetical protein
MQVGHLPAPECRPCRSCKSVRGLTQPAAANAFAQWMPCAGKRSMRSAVESTSIRNTSPKPGACCSCISRRLRSSSISLQKPDRHGRYWQQRRSALGRKLTAPVGRNTVNRLLRLLLINIGIGTLQTVEHVPTSAMRSSGGRARARSISVLASPFMSFPLSFLVQSSCAPQGALADDARARSRRCWASTRCCGRLGRHRRGPQSDEDWGVQGTAEPTLAPDYVGDLGEEQKN